MAQSEPITIAQVVTSWSRTGNGMALARRLGWIVLIGRFPWGMVAGRGL